MTYSCSGTMANYERDDLLDRLQLWCQWHENWVYKQRPSLRFPDTMPYRSPIRLNGVRNHNNIEFPRFLPTNDALFSGHPEPAVDSDDSSMTESIAAQSGGGSDTDDLESLESVTEELDVYDEI